MDFLFFLTICQKIFIDFSRDFSFFHGKTRPQVLILFLSLMNLANLYLKMNNRKDFSVNRKEQKAHLLNKAFEFFKETNVQV